MKRIAIILLTILVLFSFCACKNMSNDNKNASKITTQKQENTMSTTNNTDNTEKFDNIITVKIGDKSFSAKLYDNETAKAFADMLPLTLDMNELHGNEKYYNLDSSFPTESINVGEIKNGDIMLYGDNCLVLFYDNFSTNYSYTKIGYIENPTGLEEAVGNNNITITFSK